MASLHSRQRLETLLIAGEFAALLAAVRGDDRPRLCQLFVRGGLAGAEDDQEARGTLHIAREFTALLAAVKEEDRPRVCRLFAQAVLAMVAEYDQVARGWLRRREKTD